MLDSLRNFRLHPRFYPGSPAARIVDSSLHSKWSCACFCLRPIPRTADRSVSGPTAPTSPFLAPVHRDGHRPNEQPGQSDGDPTCGSPAPRSTFPEPPTPGHRSPGVEFQEIALGHRPESPSHGLAFGPGRTSGDQPLECRSDFGERATGRTLDVALRHRLAAPMQERKDNIVVALACLGDTPLGGFLGLRGCRSRTRFGGGTWTRLGGRSSGVAGVSVGASLRERIAHTVRGQRFHRNAGLFAKFAHCHAADEVFKSTIHAGETTRKCGDRPLTFATAPDRPFLCRIPLSRARL